MDDPLSKMQELRERVVQVLQTIYDPEIPVSIYELGLIYNIDINQDGFVDIKMTLTSPSCPAAESLPPEVEMKVAGVEGVAETRVHVVWEPTWNPDMMSESAKLELNMF